MVDMLASTMVVVLFATIGSLQGDSPSLLPGPTSVERSGSEIKLSWVDEQTLEMRLPDNTTAKIPLTPANNIPGIVVPCLFSGLLQSDAEAVVSVSGCKDKETTVSIASKKVPDGMIDLVISASGETSKIALQFQRTTEDPKHNPRIRRQTGEAVDLRMTHESDVKLTWTKANEMEVIFADGTTDEIHLIAVTNLLGEETPCLYAGSLDNDQDSEVTVIGCQGDEEVVVEIASNREAGGVLDLIISSDGKTYEVTHGNWNWENQWEIGIDGSGDALVADPEPPLDDGISALPASRDGPLPRSVTLEIYLRYDKSLLGRFSNSATQVKQWLSKVVELAKPKLALLDVKVHLKVVGSVDFYNKDIRASDAWIRYITSTENKGQKGPISYFSAGNGAGIAWVGAACHTRSGQQININEHVPWQNSELVTAKTLAHELGHNIGMNHDFDPAHGGNGRPGSNLGGCEGNGIMSYGSKQTPSNPSTSPIAWSTCSNSDFAKWYRRDGHACLRPGAGGGSGGGSEGCGRPEQGYLAAENNVPGYGGILSAGPDDCASKCSQVPGCAAWTLHLPSNYCWLKTTNTNKGEHGDWVRGEPCTSQLKGCQCNGHMSQKGRGECNSVANCGAWCYVDDDAQCLDTFPSHNGEPYRWTCEACLNNAGTSHHGLVQLVLALSVAWLACSKKNV